MYVEPVPILPPRRGRRLATTLTALGPVAALVIVVALARSADPTAPLRTAPPADGRSVASPSAGVGVEGEAGPAAIPHHAFGLPVRTVEEALAARRTGQLRDGLVAVFGLL